MACFSRRSAAFTLVELLVSISIIALLIGMLLPALQSARNAARQIQCASQVRQFALALFLYADDHKGWFTEVEWGMANMLLNPQGSRTFRGYLGAQGSGSESATQVGAMNVVLCPSRDERLRAGYVNYNSSNHLGTTYRIVAGYGSRTPFHVAPPATGNWYGWAHQTGFPQMYGAQASALPNREMTSSGEVSLNDAEQPILGDIFVPDGQPLTGFGINGGGWFGVSQPRNNHQHGTNTGFADGHVAFSQKDNTTRQIIFYLSNRLYW